MDAVDYRAYLARFLYSSFPSVVNSKKSCIFLLTKKTWNAIIEVQQNLERVTVMDKEQILNAARNEKYRGKEYENKEEIRSSALGYAITLALGFILTLIEYFSQGHIHFGMLSLGAVAVGVDNIYLGIKMKKHGKVTWGAVMLLFAAICILIYIVQVVAV